MVGGAWETERMSDRPVPTATKLLALWMEWENGTETPGRVMANLKTGGLRDMLDTLVAAEVAAEVAAAAEA